MAGGIDRKRCRGRGHDGWRVAKQVLAAVACAWTMSQPAHAQPAESSGSKPKGPKRVHIGVYVNQITGMSLKDEKVDIDFHIWFRWKDDDLKPLETFDLANGEINSKEDASISTSGGYHYAVCRCLATIQKLWNVRDFPLDDHDITIEIEDDADEEFKLEYVADAENCNVSSDARVAGWNLVAREATVVSHRANTNYGDISLPTGHESTWSRFVYHVDMVRPGYGYFGKLFTGLFIAAAISFIGLLIDASELDSRFALSVGAMFAAVASEYLVTASLPDSNILTMADKLHIMTFCFIFLTLAEATLSNKLFRLGRTATAWWLDRMSFVLMTGTYAALITAVVVWRQ